MMYNITEDDYTFVEREGQEHWVVRLKTGPYKDTFYTYGRVTIEPPEGGWTEEDEDHMGTLRFTYGLIESEHDLEELSLDKDFNDYIAEVLRHLLEDSFAKGDYRIGDELANELRDDDTTKSDQ